MQGWYGLGRIGRLEEVETRSGTRMAKFSIALDEWNSKKKEKVTTWLNVICFGGTADLVLDNFEKGDPIFIENGRVSVNEWTDENDNKRKSYDIIANRIGFVPGAGKSSGNGGASKSDYAEEKSDDSDIWDIDEDDDPFADN